MAGRTKIEFRTRTGRTVKVCDCGGLIKPNELAAYSRLTMTGSVVEVCEDCWVLEVTGVHVPAGVRREPTPVDVLE